MIVLLLLIAAGIAGDVHQSVSPARVVRVQTVWEWCQCGNGLNSVQMWLQHESDRNVTVKIGSVQWVKFRDSVVRVSWKCDGMKKTRSSYLNIGSDQWISLLLFQENKPGINNKCSKPTGKLSFNVWNKTKHISSVPFTSHTEGYACFKIPTLLKTNNGTLIAFSQARSPGCDDFDRTDLVYKRSLDNGETWLPLQKLVQPKQGSQDEGECGHKLVIGNISPLQLRNGSKFPNRIIAPYTRNNFKLWITHSDDDGVTWTANRAIPNVSQTDDHPDCNRNMSYFGYNVDQLKLKNFPDFVRYFRMVCTEKNPFENPAWTQKLKGPWQFIAVGPSQGIQLKNGRILVPGYHSPIRGLSEVPHTLPISQLYNNFAKGFALISDDEGETWRVGKQWPIGQGANQHQMIQLEDGSILSNSRSLSTGSPQFRLQSRSFDNGETFTQSRLTTIPEPFGGCQGSTAGGKGGKVFVTSPNPKKGKSLVQDFTDALQCKVNLNGREKLSLWTSKDDGNSYQFNQIIDPGLSAQTSLQYAGGKLYLLYEQVDPLPKTAQGRVISALIENLRVLLPSRFVYRELPLAEK